MRPHKARRDLLRLKEQRAEKRRKDKIALESRMSKVSEDHIDIMFLYERYTQGECWRTVEKVNDKLIKIKGKTSIRNILKDQITIYVKGLGWKEYHTAWSS